MNFSVILGNLGNTRDRFVSGGYKAQQTREEMFARAASIDRVRGIELVGSWDVCPSNVRDIKALLQQHGVELASIIPDLFSDRKWARGAFTSREAAVRSEAVSHTKEMMDVAIELGGDLVNIWAGQDGYDYLFQGNYDEAHDWSIEAIGECARHRPDVRIALEYKPREPRNFCYLARSADALLAAQEVAEGTVGVTLDVGHAFAAGENAAEAACRLMRAGRLFHLHFNDNHEKWDDDMIVGSVHTLQYAELLFWLRKMRYDGWWSMDQYPYREDAREALSESIEWIVALERKLEAFGFDRLEGLIRRGEATEIAREMRGLLFAAQGPAPG